MQFLRITLFLVSKIDHNSKTSTRSCLYYFETLSLILNSDVISEYIWPTCRLTRIGIQNILEILVRNPLQNNLTCNIKPRNSIANCVISHELPIYSHIIFLEIWQFIQTFYTQNQSGCILAERLLEAASRDTGRLMQGSTHSLVWLPHSRDKSFFNVYFLL